jgi:transposase InsO family protein
MCRATAGTPPEAMGIPVCLHGVNIGIALVDQGASRSVMRLSAYKQFVQSHGPDAPALKRVGNMCVMGSTNEVLPVIGWCVAQVTYSSYTDQRLDGALVAHTPIYVVRDTDALDIVCNLILGRSTIAQSEYSCIDTRGHGALRRPDTDGEHTTLPCLPCTFRRGAGGKQQLVAAEPTDTDNTDDTVDGVQDYTEQNKIQVHMSQLMSAHDENDADHATYEPAVINLMAAFVPNLVQKSTHTAAELTDSGEALEDLEFPFCPPTHRVDTPEYHAEKADKIAAMVEGVGHLNKTQKQQLVTLLHKHADRFSMNGENMERTDSVMHEIDTKDCRPFRERLRQYSPAIQEIIDKEVVKMVNEGVIVQSKSPYASNLLLVRKPDPSSEGGVKNRVCASFVRLNKDTEKDSYPLPNIQYIFDRIGRSEWFTTMDLLSGFWQVVIKPEHRHKTAFITMRGLYEFVVMPFGLCNAPATFQRLMDTVIKPEYRAFIETYIDDLMTHSKSFDEHLQHLDVLLCNLREHKLVVKLSKCRFAQREVKFLGHVISCNRIKTNPEAVAAIQKWQRPLGGGKKAVTAIRGFLGMAGWYRRFIPHFADIAKPLVHLTKQDTVWEWTDACQRAFEQLRDALTSSPVLAVADPNKNYVLHTDASDHAMGAILQQEDGDGHLHPIAYASKTFTDTQTRYDTTEREALAIPWALEHFNTYCEGHKYTLLTDHKALSFIRTNTNNNKRITRWQLMLQNYQLDVYYMKGSDNHAADLLSRPYMQERIAVNTTSHRHKRQVEYEVDKIIDKRVAADQTLEYLVRWKGYSPDDDTWEPTKHLGTALECVQEFERQHAQTNRRQVAAGAPVAAVTQATANAPTSKVCDACNLVCANEVDWCMHRFQEHRIEAPTDMLTKMTMTADPDIFSRLQRQEEQFRCIYNTDLGAEMDVPMNSYERRIMTNHEFVMSDTGLLYMTDITGTRSRPRAHTQIRLCIPKTERSRLMHEYHHGAAHPGIIHMYDTMREKVWWPSMKKDIYKYVSGCHQCQTHKRDKVHTLTRPMSVPTRPWSHIAIDHVGPLPTSNRGNKHIFVITDRFTRYAEAVAVTDTSARTSAEALVEYIMCRYGVFDVLLSDRGPAFTSELFSHMLKAFGIKHLRTTAFHPKSNGGVERFNKTLKRTLKLWVNQQHTDWDVLLPFALFAYNTSVHTTLNETPFYLNYARQARSVSDDVTDKDFLQRKTVHAYAHEVADKLRRVHEQVRDILNKINTDRQAALDADQVEEHVFRPGDLVYLYEEMTPIGRARKLVKRWLGPYVVVKANDNGTTVILRGKGESLVSNDRLRRQTDEHESIADQHRLDIELATQELRAIEDNIQSMQQRQAELQTAKRIAELAAEQNNDDLDSDSQPQARDEALQARVVTSIDADDDSDEREDGESDENDESLQLMTMIVVPDALRTA